MEIRLPLTVGPVNYQIGFATRIIVCGWSQNKNRVIFQLQMCIFLRSSHETGKPPPPLFPTPFTLSTSTNTTATTTPPPKTTTATTSTTNIPYTFDSEQHIRQHPSNILRLGTYTNARSEQLRLFNQNLLTMRLLFCTRFISNNLLQPKAKLIQLIL